MLKYAFEEKTLQMFTTEIAAVWSKFEEFLGIVKYIKPMAIGMLLLLLASVGMLVLTFSQNNSLDYIIQQLAVFIEGV